MFEPLVALVRSPMESSPKLEDDSPLPDIGDWPVTAQASVELGVWV